MARVPDRGPATGGPVRRFHPSIDHGEIDRLLEAAGRASPSRAREAIAAARELGGLDAADVAVLLACDDPETTDALLAAAHEVKDAIYGNRLVIFAPLYVTNACVNDCVYCAFRTSNRALVRRSLDQEEVAAEVRVLLAEGHKRLLLVAGEGRPGGRELGYVHDCIRTVYATAEGPGNIRRLNVNVAPLTVEEAGELKACGIGTFQCFQETYHRPTYEAVHPRGPKSDYAWRLGAMDRAMAGGIDDVGIGVLYGLWDWRWETLAMLQHIRHLEREFGVGPHTISVPRLEPAPGAGDVAADPPHPISDRDFQRLVAILRLTVPYTGIIMSTRETAAMRRATYALGVSQISASSRTNPGGYAHEADGGCGGAQFQLGDHRTLDEVVGDILELGHLPSFCTACYRRGRTGADFMDLARPGLIKRFCQPNALLTTQEYLQDYASERTRRIGEEVVARTLREVPGEALRCEVQERLDRTRAGERDLNF